MALKQIYESPAWLISLLNVVSPGDINGQKLL